MSEQVLTVSQFLDVINELIAVPGTFVQGEVTGFKVHPSGVYLSLKDKEDGSILDCYINPYAFRGMGIVLEDGMEVKVGGIPGIYKPKGRFSFRVETLELVGEGSLKKAYELLKRKLEQEGLFARKRPMPEFIGSIGVITSRTGAVIDDFRKNLDELGYRIFLTDVRVEGARAVGQINKAIRWFNKSKPDINVLVIIRGGGSLENLQPFNNELVAREMFASRIPTIAGIGHERDVPIASLVADAMTSTPTAAAVLINDSWERLRTGIPQYELDLVRSFEDMLADVKSSLSAGEMARIFGHAIGERIQAVLNCAVYLDSVNPERNMRLGYSIVTDPNGAIIRSVAQVRRGQTLATRLARGSFTSVVKELQSE